MNIVSVAQGNFLWLLKYFSLVNTFAFNFSWLIYYIENNLFYLVLDVLLNSVIVLQNFLVIKSEAFVLWCPVCRLKATLIEVI